MRAWFGTIGERVGCCSNLSSPIVNYVPLAITCERFNEYHSLFVFENFIQDSTYGFRDEKNSKSEDVPDF